MMRSCGRCRSRDDRAAGARRFIRVDGAVVYLCARCWRVLRPRLVAEPALERQARRRPGGVR